MTPFLLFLYDIVTLSNSELNNKQITKCKYVSKETEAAESNREAGN